MRLRLLASLLAVLCAPAAYSAQSASSFDAVRPAMAYSTQSWADPAKGLIWVVMFQRNGKGNPDNSDVRIAFQNAVPVSGR